LRKWFHSHPDAWREFRERYWEELEDKQDDVGLLERKAEEGTVTLVYSARDREHNAASELKAYIESHAGKHEKRRIEAAH
jgi:uncharacterized protein YeaO (DUF488 family)